MPLAQTGSLKEPRPSPLKRVAKVRRSANATTVALTDGQQLVLPPFLYLAPGDQLSIVGKGADRIIRKKLRHPRSGEDSFVQLVPTYSVAEDRFAGDQKLTVTFRERKNSADWHLVKALERFHYRGNGLNKIVGRRTVLIAEIEGIGVVGYGVISATVVANKARFALLGTNVAKQMRSKLINKMARIPRVVVHPEYRGLGIGARLAFHLACFAKDRWDINGHAPVLVEVIASMTHYHKFFQQAGFVEAGITGGNYRIFRPVYGQGGWDDRANKANYNFNGGNRPKPYLVFALASHIESLLQTKGFRKVEKPLIQATSPLLQQPILAKNVAVNAETKPRKSKRTREVLDVFGLQDLVNSAPILPPFSCSIRPGEIVLFTGASGSGKSTLLKLLTKGTRSLAQELIVTGSIESPRRSQTAVASVANLEERPLIDQVGATVEESIRLLNSVGLAEAHLYLKPPRQLSEGQRHRFLLATLCASAKPVWCCDEFLTGLDPLTSAIVAKGLRRLAVQYGATVLIATSNSSSFVSALKPTRLIRLNWGTSATMFNIKLTVRRRGDGFLLSAHNPDGQTLHGVKISIVYTDDSSKVVATSETLARTPGLTAFILESQLYGATQIQVTSSEGVGDVQYLV